MGGIEEKNGKRNDISAFRYYGFFEKLDDADDLKNYVSMNGHWPVLISFSTTSILKFHGRIKVELNCSELKTTSLWLPTTQ